MGVQKGSGPLAYSFTVTVKLLLIRKMMLFLKNILLFLFIGHAMPLAGSQFPNQGLNPRPHSGIESPES